MEASSKSRIYFKILILFVCISIMIITMLSVFTLRRQGLEANFAVEISESAEYVYEAQLYFEKMRSYQKSMLIYSEDLEQMEQFRESIYSSRENIMVNLEKCMASRQMHFIYEEQDITRRLLALIEEYYAYTIEMIEQTMSNDTQAVKEIMVNISPLVAEISNGFLELSMMSKDRTAMAYYEVDAYTHQSMTVIIVLSVFAIISILIASIVIMRKTSEAEPEPDNREIMKHSGNQFNDNLHQHDILLMSDLERCVSDLKAITYDLSRASKEIKK